MAEARGGILWFDDGVCSIPPMMRSPAAEVRPQAPPAPRRRPVDHLRELAQTERARRFQRWQELIRHWPVGYRIRLAEVEGQGPAFALQKRAFVGWYCIAFTPVLVPPYRTE